MDLFSAAAKKADPIVTVASETQVSPDPSSSPPRYLLPKDLSGALARLDVGEIDSLLTALIDEARRRGRRQTKESTMANEKDFQKDLDDWRPSPGSAASDGPRSAGSLSEPSPQPDQGAAQNATACPPAHATELFLPPLVSLPTLGVVALPVQ